MNVITLIMIYSSVMKWTRFFQLKMSLVLSILEQPAKYSLQILTGYAYINTYIYKYLELPGLGSSSELSKTKY